MTTTIGTTNSQNATFLNFQHKVDRCQNGVLWATFWDSNIYKFWYSTDDGVNWTEDVAGRVAMNGGNSTFFIDIDDYAHFSYTYNRIIYYRRGTPNGSRTAWTWSSQFTVESQNSPGNLNVPTIVAHRQGTGWVCHVFYNWLSNQGGTQYYTFHRWLTITSAGAISRSSSNQYGYVVVSYFGNSLDFNHTGDGKTVANGTPDLYFARSGTSGTVALIGYGKLTYSENGGVPDWDWVAPYELNIVNNQYAYNGLMAAFFDGTREVVAWVPSNNTDAITVYDIDVTTRATTLLATPPYLASGIITNLAATYDEQQNIYIWATPTSTTTGPQQTIYNRAAGTWSAWTLLEATLTGGRSVTLKRGWSNDMIEGVWTKTPSPYSVTYGSYALNPKPLAPTISLPVDNETLNLTSGVDFYYVYSDPNSDPQVGYALKRRLVTTGQGVIYGAEEWWDGSAWVGSETVVASTAQPISISDWAASNYTYQYSLANSDVLRLGLYSPYQTLNPFEWWDGTNWVPMVEGWIVSAASEVTLSGAQNGIVQGFEYNWSVATKDSWSWVGPYAPMFTFVAGGGSLARIWTGSAWLDHEIYIRVNSVDWVKHAARIWDGTAWEYY